MYRIRLHGRGGQGIQTGARILASALFAEGFQTQDAPLYGAERRGAPISATVRAARAPIRERGLLTHPDLVVVGDESLVGIPAAGVLQGAGERTWLLIRSGVAPETWLSRLGRSGRVATFALEIEEGAELPFVGAACAGGASRMLGVISRAALERALESELEALGPAARAESARRALAAWDSLSPLSGCVAGGIEPSDSPAGERPAWVELPLDPADVAAPDIRVPLTSVLVRTGLWRTQRPVIDDALCRRCSWVCSTFCPDGAISVDPDGRPRIDYDHCKGCLVCAAVCPPHAIRVEREPAREPEAEKTT
jgi:pyruvate ferredoxin oxidoreductase gamma subunit